VSTLLLVFEFRKSSQDIGRGASVKTESLPSRLTSVEMLEDLLSRPTPGVVDALSRLDGDLLILGVAGKMGPTLAVMAKRSMDEAGVGKRVLGVSRFSDSAIRERLDEAGIETICGDLTREGFLDSLPDVPNVVYMVGFKFGATGQEALTWAVNSDLSGRVARRFRHSRVVVFSSGNVYPLTPLSLGGATEATLPAPVGEYAQSVLGRERIFEHYARMYQIPTLFFRLNYAVEMRYGVLLDIARKVWVGEPIDLRMGHVNLIWQGDACAYALRALHLSEVPPRLLNVTGPETVSVRALAHRFGHLLGRNPVFEGVEERDALLSCAGQAFKLLGYPCIPLERVVEWVAAWVIDGGPTLDKPTKFGVRDGRF
jgi:nucleoside-diphosphate-sugar epimerase